jgi:tetratricopeptide (TPR) repeat protein
MKKMWLMKNEKSKFLLTILGLAVAILQLQAQNITTPRPSQYASVTQRVGISDVTITYHSPGVKGRAIWGARVPFGSIWRAGANENTTITFSHDAKVEGQEVKAGTYGLFMLPEDANNFKVLLSKYSQSWGTVPPSEDELAVQANVETTEIESQEWLSYDFVNRSGNDVTAILRWDNIQVPFNIEFDVNKIVIDNARAELKGPAGFGWRGYMQAANYCLQSDTNLEEAMTWIDQSISNSKGFSNLQVKAGLLAKKGETEEAEKVMEEALPTANAFQLNGYGYQLLASGDTKKAIEVFSMNVEKNKDHQFIWGFTDSLGEAYLKDGNKKLALKYYKLAKTKAPENQYAYLDGVIENIQNN